MVQLHVILYLILLQCKIGCNYYLGGVTYLETIHHQVNRVTFKSWSLRNIVNLCTCRIWVRRLHNSCTTIASPTLRAKYQIEYGPLAASDKFCCNTALRICCFFWWTWIYQIFGLARLLGCLYETIFLYFVTFMLCLEYTTKLPL